MSLSIPLPSGFFPTTANSFRPVIQVSPATGSRPIVVKKVVAEAKADSADVDDFIAELCQSDPRLEAAISEGTRWVSRTFCADTRPSLRKRRMDSGLTQAQLAAKMGTSQPYIAKLERGEVSAGLEVIGRLADALDLEPQEAFTLLFAEYEKKHD